MLHRAFLSSLPGLSPSLSLSPSSSLSDSTFSFAPAAPSRSLLRFDSHTHAGLRACVRACGTPRKKRARNAL